jgi:assimilatory nitrate reductase catalytic subunit
MDFDPEDVARVGRFWSSPNMARRPGLKAVDLFRALGEGRVKAVWIMATNPVVSLPEADRVLAALKGCEFVVVSDVTAATDTARLAHVLLPAAAWGEKDGTVTNSERCISRQRAFLPLPGEAKPDWWIVGEVARRMGYPQQFGYAGPAEIFAEHAALSGFENSGGRDFDLSAILPSPTGEEGVRQGLMAAYDALQPIQWPITQTGGTPRLFADGRFFTPSGKARMVAVTPRPPAHAPDAAHPFVFNTGRVRDQWHTMTRTGKTARLLAHVAEPFVEMHPDDARRSGVTEGALARIHNVHGEMLARVLENPGQRPGAVFAPIHWNGQFSGRARVGVLVHAVTDPLSGQPEFKHAPVAVAPYAAAWHGFVIARRPPARDMEGYWTRIPAKGGWRFELAGQGDPWTWTARLRGEFGGAIRGDWIELKDPAVNRYRAALLRDGRLEMACFFEREAAALPPRHWLETLLEKDVLGTDERTALLMGRPGQAAPDRGPIVCACHGVGQKDLKRAIAQGARSVEALGIRLKAGTRCGSCLPELKALLA